jgi:hypothetical protein
VGFVRQVAVAVGAVTLVVVASASLAMAGPAARSDAARSTLGGHAAPAPQPGPCLQNAAQCAGAGSVVASGATLGTAALFVGGPAVVAAALARRVRRSRRASGQLPDGMPLVIMRPPRLLSVFA